MGEILAETSPDRGCFFSYDSVGKWRKCGFIEKLEGGTDAYLRMKGHMENDGVKA